MITLLELLWRLDQMKSKPHPGCSVGWSVILYTERFDSWSGHMPRLRVRSRVGECMGRTDQCLSLTMMSFHLSVSLFLSLSQINKLERELKKKPQEWRYCAFGTKAMAIINDAYLNVGRWGSWRSQRRLRVWSQVFGKQTALGKAIRKKED